MVRLRLRRIGLKGQPTYRVVAADKESPRDGRFLEILGFYNPRTQRDQGKLVSTQYVVFYCVLRISYQA